MLFAEYLANESMPKGYKFSGTIDKRSMSDNLTRLAKDDPTKYSEVVHSLKRTGDILATNEGISVSLDDITPDYKARDRILTDGRRRFSLAKTEDQRIAALLHTQNAGMDFVRGNKGSLGRQVASGSRGKPGQLMKTIFSPVVAKGRGDLPQPYLIDKSYSEGLTPGQFWLTAGESRRELATTQLATAIPGDTSKQMAATLNSSQITQKDCGTKNGISFKLSDPHIVGRYEAKTNKKITDSYVRSLKKKRKRKITARSPLSCLEHPGVCQMCYGNDNRGSLHDVGTNIGLRSAQALSEPLTQMVLSSKHGGQLAKSSKPELSGTMGFRQLMDIPRVFKDEATLSTRDGRVLRIWDAPQGGKNVDIEGVQHYVSPKMKLAVQKGSRVSLGDPVSEGITNPRTLVDLKGLGYGRKYLTDTIRDIYTGSGVDMDKRHIELLVKQDLNAVQVDRGDTGGRFTRGDLVPYNAIRDHYQNNSVDTRVSSPIIGKRLGEEFLHFTAGTKVDQHVYDQLKDHKVKNVRISNTKAAFTPVMKSLEQVPLLSSDWVARLSHRRIKDTLLEGAGQGWESDTSGKSPYPSLLFRK